MAKKEYSKKLREMEDGFRFFNMLVIEVSKEEIKKIVER